MLSSSGSKKRAAVIAALVVVALAVRAGFFKYETGDYAIFHSWYEFIKQHGGFGALRYNFANYNEPYLYLLALVSYTPLSPLVGIKLISVAFDLLLGFFAYRTVRLRYAEGWAPTVSAAAVLFLPTVVLNSSLWGQIDASYTSLALGGVYFVLKRRGWAAGIFFGLAVAFKLQAIFLAPLVLLLVLRRRLRWRELLAAPAAFVVMDLPALLIGASVSTLWSTYAGEVSLYHQLTLNAPNIYQYLDFNQSPLLRDLGTALTAAVIVCLIAWALHRQVELSATSVVLTATVSVLLVPFLLPAMHERYFYLADVFTVISAFYLPRRLWALPVLEQFASLFSYMPFLLATTTTASSTAGATGRPALTGRGPSPQVPPGSSPQSSAGLAPNDGGQLGHGTALVPHGIDAITSHAVVSFKILSTAMLAALLLALWAGARELRAPRRPVARHPDVLAMMTALPARRQVGDQAG
ncbi:MAG TPA: glycosyltransferase 87 family protein [Acidimicrobiales bacterium]|nr:glycosyltransferase 87 family protein [Acidimicrobiales bacterium]